MKVPADKFLLVLLVSINIFSMAVNADTLDDIRTRGFLRCGITENTPGFSIINDAGEREGFFIEQCKTISAAIFGKFSIEYVPLTPNTAFVTLQAGGVDVFAAGATWTFIRDTSMGLNFTGVSYYAGQGFLVRKNANVSSVSDLDGATICITQGSTNEQNLSDYFILNKLTFTPVTFADMKQALDAYEAERCDAVTNERISLAVRKKTLENPEEHLIMKDMISKEPVGAVVRHGDDRWLDIIVWSFNVRIAAEELGINQANVEQLRKNSKNPEVQRLLGLSGNFGLNLGLSNDWAYQIIKLVGNYGDIWDRIFTPMGLERGLNDLWSRGGLLSALPFR
jgi:general L-amino acid transport system substrate-binding protein